MKSRHLAIGMVILAAWMLVLSLTQRVEIASQRSQLEMLKGLQSDSLALHNYLFLNKGNGAQARPFTPATPMEVPAPPAQWHAPMLPPKGSMPMAGPNSFTHPTADAPPGVRYIPYDLHPEDIREF